MDGGNHYLEKAMLAAANNYSVATHVYEWDDIIA